MPHRVDGHVKLGDFRIPVRRVVCYELADRSLAPAAHDVLAMLLKQAGHDLPRHAVFHRQHNDDKVHIGTPQGGVFLDLELTEGA